MFLRWKVATVDVSFAQVVDDVLDLVTTTIEQLYGQAAGRPLALRVELREQCRAHRTLLAKTHHRTNEIRSLAVDGRDLR
jgi:hypothetical protein